jgi:chromate transporter
MSSKNTNTLSLFKLFRSFFQVGCFTFGGGFAMIPLIQREIVDKTGWMENEEFIDMLAVTQSSPGPVAVNAAVFVGYNLAGLPGALTALFGTVLPSFLIILLFAVFLASQGQKEVLQNFFTGVRPAIVALVLCAGINLGRKSLAFKSDYVLCLIALLLLLFFSLHPILLIIMGALAGILRNHGLSAKKEEG